MIIIIASIARYFLGYVDFTAIGADIEKFITFLAKNGIEIISYTKKEYVFYGKILAKDYLKIKRYAKRCGLKLKIRKKHGIIFDIRKNINKIGFFTGLIFIIFFVYCMNMFIWQINVTGNLKVETEEILKSANEMGLLTGTLSKKHFVQNIEWYILRKHPELSSVEINIQGSVANILINEIKKESEMVSDDDIPVNIVAGKYGVIRRIDVFDGQKAVNKGDAVMKGDLLVSAVYEDRHNKLTLKHARANVIAETDYNMEIEFPLKEKILKKNKLEKTTFIVSVLGKKYYFGYNKNGDYLSLQTNEKQINFLWLKLPIIVTKIQHYSVKGNTITHNLEEGRIEAFELLRKKEKETMSDMEIISRKTEEKIKNGKYIINADYIVLMDIAEEQPIESDVPWENSDDIS